MNEQASHSDLLTLIGRAIQLLKQTIDSLRVEETQAGLAHLSTVIREIDAYLCCLDDDPLLQLAAVDRSYLQNSLHHVQQDLAIVIDSVQQTMS